MQVFTKRIVSSVVFAFFSVSCFLTLESLARAEERVALVIGNSDYEKFDALSNPERDARAIGAALDRLGFDVTLALNLSKNVFDKQLADFSDKVIRAEIAVVYYAGHGMEMDGRNYLVPIDAQLASDNKVRFEAVSLDFVLGALEGTKGLKLVLLDACRDNPFVRSMKRTLQTRSIGRGLAEIEVRPGVLVSYAAAAGTTALDGDGDHSPYTEGLLNYLEQPGLEINLLFRKVADYVQEKTHNNQVPFEYGRLPGQSIYLKNSETEDEPITQTFLPSTNDPSLQDPCIEADIQWQAIKDLKSKQVFESHIRIFNACSSAELAEKALKSLANFSSEPGAPVTDCDRLAAHPNDKTNPINTGRVPFGDLDPARAVPACQMAVQRYPAEARLLFQLGRSFDKGQAHGQAMFWYSKAADLGSTLAIKNITSNYFAGTGGVQQDYLEALSWYRKAADLGDTDAMNYVGSIYYHGYGAEPDQREALSWYHKAADLGDADAMFHLGSYYKEVSINQDYRDSLFWYRKAAGRGHAKAMYNIAVLYDSDDAGILKDTSEAAKWMIAAISNQYEPALNEMTNGAEFWSTSFRRELQRYLLKYEDYKGKINGNIDSKMAKILASIYSRSGNSISQTHSN